MSLYCYCGRSETPPFCDGSHALPRPRSKPQGDKGSEGDDGEGAKVPHPPDKRTDH